MVSLLKDEILEKIFSDEEMQKIPIGTQATAVNVFEKILDDIRRDKSYDSISELFTDE